MMYPFFSASLPEFFAGEPSEITLAEFDDGAREEMSESDFQKLISWSSPAKENASAALPPVYSVMRRFDDYLFWRIASHRAEQLNRTVEFPVPEEFFSEVDAFLPAAAAASPADREKAVDQIRWRKLEELDTDCFDFNHLCIYRLKLLMAEKFSRRNRDGKALFQQAVETVNFRFEKSSSSSQEK